MVKSVLCILMSCGVLASGYVWGQNSGDGGVEQQGIASPRESVEVTSSSFDSFGSIHLSAMSPDIRIEVGEDFGIEYKLHDREKLKRVEVVDDTLYFETGFQYEFDVDYGQFYVNITVPEGTSLENVDIKTVAGDIYTDVAKIDDGSFITTSGMIEIDGSSIPTISCKSTSESLKLVGDFDLVDLHTVAGSCYVSSNQIRGKVATVSGNIDVSADTESLTATRAC